jgi:crotonobetainyl-CoA:carnitine CoA-transferase CaiB-like acyl-CoA transferase
LNVIELRGDRGSRYCGRLFAMLGATVVQIPPLNQTIESDLNATPFDAWLDEAKTAAATFDEALAILGGMGRRPDVVLVGQAPDSVVDADRRIAAAGIEVVRLGLTWFGQTGPLAGWRGDEALVQALSGLAFSFGEAEGSPTLAQASGIQVLGGATLFMAGLATLWGRKAATVDVSILEAAMCFTELGPAAMAARPPMRSTRKGVNRYGAMHPGCVFPASDGWIGVSALTPAQWAALCDLIERPDLARDPRFATNFARIAHADEVDAALAPALAKRPAAHWLIEGQKARVPLGPVPDQATLLATPHWRERGSFQPVAGRPEITAPALPFRLDCDGQARAKPAAQDGGPLAGVRIIDFSMGWAGPLATRHLADLGAEVIKIESRARYDWSRGYDGDDGSDPPKFEVQSSFSSNNRNKKGVDIDLTSPAGLAQAKALVAGADIVIENYGPGVMDKLGLGAEALRALRPGLVFVSMAAFGATGPWSFFRAYGSTVEQASGMPTVNGHAHWPPSLQHLAYGDPVAGVFGALAALVALHGRATVGGAAVDLSQVECLFQLGAEATVAAQTETPWRRGGSRGALAAPRCVAPTADPEISLAVVATDAAAWAGLCKTLGREDWASDPRLQTIEGRNAKADEIEAAIADWASALSPEEAAETLQAAGCPAAPVLPPHALGAAPHLAGAGFWAWLERRYVGRHMLPAAPYRIDGERPALLTPAPTLGEHTREVLAALVPG